MEAGYEPIADDEIIYRRIPVSTGWYDPDSQELAPEAFGPRKDDISGISVSRAKYKTIEQAAQGRPGKSYYVAILLAGDIRRAGMNIEPRPELPGGIDPSHAEIIDLNAANRKDDTTLARQHRLVELCLEVKGPYHTADA